jgi:hypothetical protein
MRSLLLFLTAASFLSIAACGGGSSPTALPPVFTSNPGLSAAQDVLYTYNITATNPSGGTVSFAVSSGPAGASISGSTLSWTPTAAQSRTTDAFTITATSSEGGHATQSWTLTPSGTISGKRIDTHWTASGSTAVPFDWTSANQTISALIPQSGGSFQTLTGTGAADGTFTIPQVPGGYYWLQIYNTAYWTSSSTIDLGWKIAGRKYQSNICAFCQPTMFNFDISGLDAMPVPEQLRFYTDITLPAFLYLAQAGSTTFVSDIPLTGPGPLAPPDISEVNTAFFLQVEPTTVDSIRGEEISPELTFANLTLNNNQDNPIAGTLVASPSASFDLAVQGSAWAPLFNNVGPSAAMPVGAYMNVIAQPFLDTSDGAIGAPWSLNLPLFETSLTHIPLIHPALGVHPLGPCLPGPEFTDMSDNIAVYAAPILSDQDFGTLQYGDPFQSGWPRFLSICQTATMSVPVPGSNNPATVVFDAGINTTLPTSSVAPLISQAQNPTIQGTSFYTASTITTLAPTIAWSAPASGTASGYKIEAYVLTTLPDGKPGYVPFASYYTRETSVNLPGLQSSNTYVFVLTAVSDPVASPETAPNRSGLPNGFASVVSGPITISAGTQ